MFSDIIIIGAGPCGLAAAARLCEKTPSALFTNDEHTRYWKKHRRQHNSLEQEQRKRKLSADSGYGSGTEDRASRPTITVLDACSDEWLTTWKKRFRDLKISHLRSPLFFHSDPQDRDGLLAFAHEQGRVDELREIPNVAGKELSKHEKKRQNSRKPSRKIPAHLRVDGRDQIDYFTPSSQLFLDHCDTVIDRYRLRNLVHKAKVLDITFERQPQNLDHGLFTLKTETSTLYSRIVIIATGPSSQPTIPNLRQLSPSAQKGGISHVFSPNGTLLPPSLQSKLTATPTHPFSILIIGGGLTSAQLIDLLLTTHKINPNLHIHLLLRHPKLKQKPFDIDLPWVTKTRNQLMSTYWSADTDLERLTMLRTARNGGSVNPPFARILQSHAASGKVTIHVGIQLTLDETCIWDETEQTWTSLNISPSPSSSSSSSLSTPSQTFTFPPSGINHIIFCTGAIPDITSIPFLRSLQQDIPIETLGGLPVLNDDLMYCDDVPLFFTGALAALRLGPGAANLAGARQGAERVAWGVEEILGVGRGGEGGSKGEESGRGGQRGKDSELGVERGDGQKARSEFTGSFSNQFAALDIDTGTGIGFED